MGALARWLGQHRTQIIVGTLGSLLAAAIIALGAGVFGGDEEDGPSDPDHDGIVGVSDKCPSLDPIRDADRDGCEDRVPSPSDRDGDGIPDSTDECPDEAPTKDDDGDGCDDQPPPPPPAEPCWDRSEGEPSQGYEPNNRRTSAFGPLGSGIYRAKIGTDNDEDWYAFCVRDETELEVTVSLTDCDMTENDDCFNLFGGLYPEEGDPVGEDEIAIYSLDEATQSIDYTTPGPGLFFVKVSGDKDNEYELQVGPASSLTKKRTAAE